MTDIRGILADLSPDIRLTGSSSAETAQTPVPILREAPVNADLKRRRKALGDAIATLEKSNDGLTASKILENLGLPPAQQGESAIAKLEELVIRATSEEALIPLEHAFSTTLNPNSDQKIELFQRDVQPAPEASATPPLPSN